MEEEKKQVVEGAVAPEQRSAQPRKENGSTAQSKPTLTRETVTVFATLDEAMLNAIETIAEDRGITLVRLEERVIDDYLAARGALTPDQQEVKTVEDFVRDENNRAKAENDAKRLYSFLTKDPIERFKGKRFTRKDIVKRTNLSNTNAIAMLRMLEAFGYVRMTGGKTEEFEFEFRPEAIHATVRRQAMAMLTECAKDFVRYRALIDNDPTLTKKQREKEVSSLKAEFRRLFA